MCAPAPHRSITNLRSSMTSIRGHVANEVEGLFNYDGKSENFTRHSRTCTGRRHRGPFPSLVLTGRQARTILGWDLRLTLTTPTMVQSAGKEDDEPSPSSHEDTMTNYDSGEDLWGSQIPIHLRKAPPETLALASTATTVHRSEEGLEESQIPFPLDMGRVADEGADTSVNATDASLSKDSRKEEDNEDYEHDCNDDYCFECGYGGCAYFDFVIIVFLFNSRNTNAFFQFIHSFDML